MESKIDVVMSIVCSFGRDREFDLLSVLKVVKQKGLSNFTRGNALQSLKGYLRTLHRKCFLIEVSPVFNSVWKVDERVSEEAFASHVKMFNELPDYQVLELAGLKDKVFSAVCVNFRGEFNDESIAALLQRQQIFLPMLELLECLVFKKENPLILLLSVKLQNHMENSSK